LELLTLLHFSNDCNAIEYPKNVTVRRYNIEESQSAWFSPIVMVSKPGKVRICIDCRKVNSFTEKDSYPLHQINGILSRLPKAEFITRFDLKDAYWQVPLEVNSRDKTAFPGRPLYQFKLKPFGLCNATSNTSRLMDKVVLPHYRNEVFVKLRDSFGGAQRVGCAHQKSRLNNQR